jgi:alanyl-tRNA synthetase
MTAKEIIEKYIKFFEEKPRSHKRIPNAPLIPENDPTTLFTSSGMQPLVPYLLGEPHPMGKRLVNVQNCFRAQDIDEVGDSRHTIFFRMLGNWSLGDYFKKEEIPWLWELLTKEFKLPKEKLFITVFKGGSGISYDQESYNIWSEILTKEGFDLKEKIFSADASKNWWSRSGTPDKMPPGEPGGPDTEVYYKFDDLEHDKKCKDNPVDCECGKFIEIANSVFMQYQKQKDGSFKELPQKNVDYGGGVERLMSAVENKQDIFTINLFDPIIKSLEKAVGKNYKDYKREMRIITDHLVASVFIISNNIIPSNKEQGYILRRLIRRALDNFYELKGEDISPILEEIVEQYGETDSYLTETFEVIKNTILEEQQRYKNTLANAKEFIHKKYKAGDEIKGITEISAEDAFILYSTHGLSPTQIKSLGYIFNGQEFAEKMKAHQNISRAGATKKFAGGLADHSEKTIMGHTATHLLHKVLRDMFGTQLHQTGSNITPERVRFDFNFDRNLTTDEIKKVEETVNQKIKENLPVHFEMLPLEKAKQTNAIGLFDEKYGQTVKVYFIGPKTKDQRPYSVEFCGGPHVKFTSEIKSFKIIKQENIGKGNRRIYAKIS